MEWCNFFPIFSHHLFLDCVLDNIITVTNIDCYRIVRSKQQSQYCFWSLASVLCTTDIVCFCSFIHFEIIQDKAKCAMIVVIMGPRKF